MLRSLFRFRRAFCTSTSKSIVPDGLIKYVDTKIELKSYPRVYHNVHYPMDLLKVVLDDIEDLQILAKPDNPDPELRAMAVEDLAVSEAKAKGLVDQIVGLILPSEPYDENDASFEVRAGAGGKEAGLFAEEVFHFYRSYMISLGFEVAIVDYETLGVGRTAGIAATTGVQRATAHVTGLGVFRRLKHECGVHRVQRVPVTGLANARMQTSTCSVAVVPLPKQKDMDINQKELKIDFTRASGPGGQNVNKSESACRVVHVPTGVSAECQEFRTASKNRDKAVEKLRRVLFERRFNQEMSELSANRKSQVGNMNRNEKIRTYNYTRNMITDHRIGLSKTVPNLAQYFLGHFGFSIVETFEEELTKVDREKKLAELIESSGDT